ncbi:MAG: ribulokinase [Lachnospiraceae bacterium]|nr:ribulokinase [Lachnospiraceae bacterium]
MAEGYTLGVDLGSLSARAVIVRVWDGCVVATGEEAYEHGVIEGSIGGIPIPEGMFLQKPGDFIRSLQKSVRKALQNGNVDPGEIMGIGVDATSPTIIATDVLGKPILESHGLENHPFAQALMWKSHASMREVEDILELARERKEPFLAYTGKSMGSNLPIPKLLHLVRNAPKVYEAADRYFDLSDWIVKLLTGKDTMNDSTAGGKFFWRQEAGFPSREFFSGLDGRLHNFLEKIPDPHQVIPAAECAGRLTQEGARLLGLLPGTVVSAGHVDAAAPLAFVGLNKPHVLFLSIGTSVSGYIVDPKLVRVEGIYGVLEDFLAKGLYAYEIGLQSFGDTLAWFVENCCPEELTKGASKGEVFARLNERAERLQPCGSGLLALNWWNGNRSPLMDGDLSGVILGLTLNTKPEEIYRALAEAMAFNFRWIAEGLTDQGLAVHQVLAGGGIPMKNRFLMQLISDVLGKEVHVPKSGELAAQGSAIFAAVAAGAYETLDQAVHAMGMKEKERYTPNLEHTRKYEKLYHLYVKLCRELGKGESPLKRLGELRTQAKAGTEEERG